MTDSQYSPGSFRILPPVVKNLIIINILFFLAMYGFGSAFNIDLTRILGLHYFQATDFRPWQFATYMFMHGSLSHIFFNMFALWMFGSVLEHVWGMKRFLFFYFVTGIGAALVHYIVFYIQISPVLATIESFLSHPDPAALVSMLNSQSLPLLDHGMVQNYKEFAARFNELNITNTPEAIQLSVNYISQYKIDFLNAPVVVGASGAIFGLLLAFGMLFPNSLIYLYFFIPIKAKWFVIFYGLAELISGFYDSGSNVAHFAHLGGMLFGVILILIWRHNDRKKSGFFNYYN